MKPHVVWVPAQSEQRSSEPQPLRWPETGGTIQCAAAYCTSTRPVSLFFARACHLVLCQNLKRSGEER
jgi:hypothetical protein